MNKKDKVLIFVHGFKKQGKNDFDFFLDSNPELNKNFIIEKIEYYDGNNKDTLSIKKFDKEVLKIFEKYKDKEVKIIAYSFGCVLSLINSINYKNIKDMFLIMPTFFISYSNWVKMFKEMKVKEKELREKLGNERFERIMKKMVDKYVIKTSIVMNKYLKRRKLIKKVEGKNITSIYSVNDNVSIVNKSIPFFKKNIEFKNNLELISVEDSHFGVLDFGKDDNINNLLHFINK